MVYGSVAANDKEIALLTRSVLEILPIYLLTLMYRQPRWTKSARFLPPRRRSPTVRPCRRTDADSQLVAKTRRCLCRRAVWSRLVLDRRQRLRLQAAVFFYHVSLHAHRHGRKARRAGHHSPGGMKIAMRSAKAKFYEDCGANPVRDHRYGNHRLGSGDALFFPSAGGKLATARCRRLCGAHAFGFCLSAAPRQNRSGSTGRLCNSRGFVLADSCVQ